MTGGKPPFEELYQESVNRIYAFVRAQVGGAADAEDITAQVFVKAWEAYPRYEPRQATPVPWLFTIARNAIRDHNRGGRRRDRLAWLVGRQPDEVADASELAEGRIRHAELLEAMGRLSERHRDVVALRHSGLSFAEVGTAMGTSEDAAKMLHQRALRALRALLAPVEEGG